MEENELILHRGSYWILKIPKKEAGPLSMKNIPYLMLNYTFIKIIYEITLENKCDGFTVEISYH